MKGCRGKAWLNEAKVWQAIKQDYAASVDGRPDSELARSFFNSISRRIFATEGVCTVSAELLTGYSEDRAQSEIKNAIDAMTG